MFHLPDDPPESPPLELRLGLFRDWRDGAAKLATRDVPTAFEQ
ncbi:hypothetical protein VSR68_25250 [Paraburkholderia phymatum]